jgi:hypothetical protein
MSWVITGAEKTPVDPQFGSVSLLLHGNGANGSTTITDSSRFANTVTAVGNAQISTAQSKFGGASIAFDGSGDWITVSSDPAFSFGTGDFTVEFFARWNSFANVNVIFDTRDGAASANGIVFYTTSGGVFVVYRGVAPLITGATLQTAQWYHIAVSRSSGTTRLFVDGVQSGSSASDSANYTDQNFFVGKTNEALSNYFNGYIDELRITKGIARYTANFTPPTAPFPDI